MFINAAALSSALSNISAMASLDKSQPGILFNIKDDSVDVYYNSQSKAIIETIPAIVEEDDIKGKIVFDYKRLTDTINHCKTSGRVIVEQVEFKLVKNTAGPGTAKIHVVKTMQTSDGETTSTEVVSTNSYELSWWGTDALTIQQRILNNPACENMFPEDDAMTIDTPDFVSMINEACSGDAKVIYFSPKYNGAFSVNTNSCVMVKNESKITKIIPLQTASAKAIGSIFNSSGVKEIYINTLLDDKGRPFACLFFNAEHTLSIYMSASQIANPHLMSISRYVGMDYKSYQINLMTDVLKDTLQSIVSLSTATDGYLEFVNDPDVDGQVNLIMTAENTGSSVNNIYRLRCNTFNTQREQNENDTTWFKVPVNTKQFLDIIKNNKEEFTGLDFFEENGAMFLRIGFVNLARAQRARDEYRVEKNFTEDQRMTLEDKLDLRERYVDTSYFITVKQGK